MLKRILVAMAVLSIAFSAQAQTGTNFNTATISSALPQQFPQTALPSPVTINPSTDYIAVARYFPSTLDTFPGRPDRQTDLLITNYTYLPISAVLQQSNSQMQAQFDQLSAKLDSLRSGFNKLAEGVALASAMTTLAPNPGDRFFVSVTGAGFDSYAAGAINITARLNDRTLAYGGYARSANQNMVKGGIGMSLR